MLDSLCVEQLMNLIQFLNIIWFSNCKAIRNASRLKNYHHTFRVVGNQTQMTKLNKCNQFNPLFTFLFLLADLHNLMIFSEIQDQIFYITTITRIHHCKIYAKYGTKELHEKKKILEYTNLGPKSHSNSSYNLILQAHKTTRLHWYTWLHISFFDKKEKIYSIKNTHGFTFQKF